MKITVTSTVRAGIDKVWQAWNNPDDIRQWNAASEDWHTTQSTVDLREGGCFTSRMEAKDGSTGFDFSGTYTRVIEKKLIEYTLDDGRTVSVVFEPVEAGTRIRETFDADAEYDVEQQRQGWQAILDKFTAHVENSPTGPVC